MSQLTLMHLTLDQYMELIFDQYFILPLELLDIITVTNIGNQLVIININSMPNSHYFLGSGPVSIQPKRSLTAEEDRFDLSQLKMIRQRGMIQVSYFKRPL
jgi:hypothetical protein